MLKRAAPPSSVQTPLDARCVHLRKGCGVLPADKHRLSRLPLPRPSQSLTLTFPSHLQLGCIPEEASGRANSPPVVGAQMGAQRWGSSGREARGASGYAAAFPPLPPETGGLQGGVGGSVKMGGDVSGLVPNVSFTPREALAGLG